MKFYDLIIPKGFKGSASELSGGCGSDKAWLDFVPDSFIGVDISICCKIHDYMYTIGGTEKDRDIADRTFRTNLKSCVLNYHNLIFRPTNLSLVETYYMAVHRYGMSSFNYSKSEKNIES